MLDPGHGGHDPGAVGPKNLYEKDVVLDIALKLKKILASDPNLDIFLTRETDVFIPLEKRTAVAISKKADLFLSIHANASPRRDAKGIETYFLNWTNDEEAMKVAARENAISLKKMKKLNEGKDVLDVMLSDLRRDNKRDESLKLANFVQQNMVSSLNRSYSHIVDHGVKQALFYVLFGAQMPSEAFGQATETNTALHLTQYKSKAIGQVTETEAARALARVKNRLILQVTETDIANPITNLTGTLLNMVEETDSAQALWPKKRLAIAQTVEVEFDQPLRPVKRLAWGKWLSLNRPKPWHPTKSRSLARCWKLIKPKHLPTAQPARSLLPSARLLRLMLHGQSPG